MEELYYNPKINDIKKPDEKIKRGYIHAYVYTIDEIKKIGIAPQKYKQAYLRMKNDKIAMIASSMCGKQSDKFMRDSEWFGKVVVVIDENKYKMIDLNNGKILVEDSEEIFPISKEYYTTNHADNYMMEEFNYGDNYEVLKKNGVIVTVCRNICPVFESRKFTGVSLNFGMKIDIAELDKRYEENLQYNIICDCVDKLKNLGISDKEISKKLKTVLSSKIKF